MQKLRAVVLTSGLKEEIKWSVPVYTLNGKNVVTVSALKNAAVIGFFKGVLLSDTKALLKQQGNIQAARILTFHSVEQVDECTDEILSFLTEAIAIERSGRKVNLTSPKEPMPPELQKVLDTDSTLASAFYALTPGRQRGYLIYFNQAKQELTRRKRIEQCKTRIMRGKGWNEREI